MINDPRSIRVVDPFTPPADMRRARITIRKVEGRPGVSWRWQLPVWTGSYYEGWACSQPEALRTALAFLAGLPAGLVQP